MDSKDQQLNFLWTDLILPPDSRALRLVDEARNFERELKFYLGSRVFPQFATVIIDSKFFFEIGMALPQLFPSWTVFILGVEARALMDFGKYCKINKVDSVPAPPVPGDVEGVRGSKLLVIEDEYESVFSKLGGRVIGDDYDCFAFRRSTCLTGTALAKNPSNRYVSASSAGASNDFRYGAYYKLENKLDIIVPLFNCMDYVNKCVRSLLSSGRRDINVIVVDDGSTDKSCEFLLREFGSNPNFSLLKKANGGCASARNYGRQHSNASHIAFVDADDFVDDVFFPRLLNASVQTGAEIVQGEFLSFDGDSYSSCSLQGVLTPPPAKNCDVVSIGWVRRPSHTLMTEPPSIWRRVFRKDWLDSYRIFFPESLRAFDDWYFSILGLSHTRTVIHVPDVRYHYRQHPKQDSKQRDDRHFFIFYSVQLLMQRLSVECSTSFFWQAKAFLAAVNWSLSNLDPRLVDEFRASTLDTLQSIYRIFGHNALPVSSLRAILDTEIRSRFLSYIRQCDASNCELEQGALVRAGRYHPDIQF